MPLAGEGRRSGGAAGLVDRAPLLLAVAVTAVAAADLVRLALVASGRWPWPWVWTVAAAWAWWLSRRGRRMPSPSVPPSVPPPLPPSVPPLPRRAGIRIRPTVAVSAATLFAVLATVQVAVVLHRANPWVGHDEAVYANLARSWTGPLPAAGFRSYRPVALSAVGAAVLRVAGGSADPDHQLVLLRTTAVALTLLALGAMLLLGRAVTSPARAVTAVLVVLASATFQVRVGALLDDIPSAGLLCLSTLLLLRAMRSGRLLPLVAAVLTGVGTFYVRYGALLALVALAVAAVVADGPRAWWARRGQLAVAVAAGLAGLVPFAVYSARESGTPWGVLAGARDVAGGGYPAEGLVQYVLWAPIRLLGNLGGLVLLAALVALVLALRRPVGDDRRRWQVLLAGSGLLQVVLLGLSSHAEVRYVFFALMAAAVVGVDAIARVAGRYARPAVALLAAFAVLQLPASLWFDRRSAGRASDEHVAMMRAAGRAGPAPCLAVGPRWGPAPDPEVGWYSGCDVTPVRGARPPGSCAVRLVVLVGTGADRDPRVERAAAALLARSRAACPAGTAAPAAPLDLPGPGGHGVRLLR